MVGDDGSDEEKCYEKESEESESQEEIQVLIVGVHFGARQRGIDVGKSLMTHIDNVTGAYSKDWVCEEYLPAVTP